MKRILRLEDSAQRKLMVESIRAKSEEIQEESLKGAIAANEQEKKERQDTTSKIVNAVWSSDGSDEGEWVLVNLARQARRRGTAYSR